MRRKKLDKIILHIFYLISTNLIYLLFFTDKNGDAITSEQIRLLNEIGMVWQINASFDEMYHYLEVYKSHYGDISIPSKFNTNDGYTYAFDGSIKLGKWLLNQRINTSPLSKNGLKLSLLGINWPRG